MGSAIDRTEWNFGKTTINILKISVVCNGVGIPLIWMLLHSNTAERTALLDRLRAVYADLKRYAVERCDWKTAANLQVRPSKSAYADAMTHFARVLEVARSGDPTAAKADIVKLAELRKKLREAKDGYWTEQVDIQWQVATTWMLYAEGKYDEALKATGAAADAEDKTEKHPATPGVPTPARELYGAMLLERGLAKERSQRSKRRSRRRSRRNQIGCALIWRRKGCGKGCRYGQGEAALHGRCRANYN